MGFDTIQDWSEFDNALAALRAQPGVFASEAERESVIGAVKGAIAHEQEAGKKMQMGLDFAALVTRGFSKDGLLKLFPYLLGIV